jgi:hypothetical protein
MSAVLIDRWSRHTPDEVPDAVPIITSLTELLPIVDARLLAAKAS